MTGRPTIGELLVKARLITPLQRDHALELQKILGGKLGDILTAEGYVHHLKLHQVLAAQQEADFIDLMQHPPEEALLSAADRRRYLMEGCIPWRRIGGRLHLAAVNPGEARRWAQARYGEAIALHHTSPRDIQCALSRRFFREDDADARMRLWKRHPAFSARTRLVAQPYRFAPLLLLAALALYLATQPEAMGPCLWGLASFYAAHLVFKGILFAAATGAPRPAPPPDVPDAGLPVYTVLAPLYREARSVPGLLAAMRGLDYPRSKLDVKLIVEEDDEETWQAIRAARPESFFDVIRVPPSEPRTKPKALNYAQRYAKGEYLTIYDAEDRPEADQLRKAVAAFRAAPERLSCLQGRLNYFNREENLLTRWFALEYAIWFHYFLPGLSRLGIPLPLGGTSNHMPVARLRELAAWDPYNVTEDADLGLRIAGFGQTTAVLDSTTWEEAPIAVKPWLKQRGRWIKGYLQTWIVHMRRPARLWRRTGTVGFLGVQLFVGAPCLIFLLGPAFWLLTLGWATGLAAPAVPLPLALKTVSLAVLMGSMIQHIVFAVVSSRKLGWRGMGGAILTFPFYWILHSVASFRAVWQLIVAPHQWDKTAHGVSRFLTRPPHSS